MGLRDAFIDGSKVGEALGSVVGSEVGSVLGTTVGSREIRARKGNGVGTAVGTVGLKVGS